MKSESLYNAAIATLARSLHLYAQPDISLATTDRMKFDLVRELHSQRRFALLVQVLVSWDDGFCPVLCLGERRTELHAIFQRVIDAGYPLHRTLVDVITDRLSLIKKCNAGIGDLTVALNFASFLSDAGWYEDSAAVLRAVKGGSDSVSVLAGQTLPPAAKREGVMRRVEEVKEEVSLKLLHSSSAFCDLVTADKLFNSLHLDVRREGRDKATQAAYFTEFSAYCYVRSKYDESYAFAMQAVSQLQCGKAPPKTMIDALRQASKACVVKRLFAKAELLIQAAVSMAREVFGISHPKYADCLVDYGFYLLNVDSIRKSLQAYRNALEVRHACFGGENLKVALAHEDLAYATYVYEYNSGHFDDACLFAEKALSILEKLLPDNHILLASSKRVLALILEEIAIDNTNKEEKKRMLSRSEELHLSALELASNAFGEMNVVTSKHYGNLGRLYQSMELYEQAETMHLKAIEIKEFLLGKEDYEVALSIGHLASLYNYDLNEYAKAEVLYLRSVDIGVKLFGPSYSGLEYDYRGLIRIYSETQEWNKYFDYTHMLRNWKELRDQKTIKESNEEREANLVAAGESVPIMSVISTVMEWKGTSSSSKALATANYSIESASSSSGVGSSMEDEEDEEDDDLSSNSGDAAAVGWYASDC